VPAKKVEPIKKASGRYATAGLDSKQFLDVFNRIAKENAKRRNNAKRTITPAMLKRKSVADLAKLGKKQDGTNFTSDDLAQLEKNKKDHERKYDSKTAGITYAQIISSSRSIDIKRANNGVSDGSGITAATIVALRANEVMFRVKASIKNNDDDHMVRLRLETWDENLSDADVSRKGYQKATSQAVKDRVSFACDCGRHQYWYRYLATIGNYGINPPKETSSPKIRNPNLTGVACKHVLHVINKLQSPTWTNQLAIHMQSQAKKIGYLDDDNAQHVFTDKERKKQRTTRKGKINQDAVKAAFEKYQKAQVAIARKIDDGDKKELAKLRAGMKKREGQLAQQNKALAKERKEKGNLIRGTFPMFKDMNKKENWSNARLQKEFASKFGMNINTVRAVLDGE
jgi:hypothetical protein